jgi:hypothetical protein
MKFFLEANKIGRAQKTFRSRFYAQQFPAEISAGFVAVGYDKMNKAAYSYIICRK